MALACIFDPGIRPIEKCGFFAILLGRVLSDIAVIARLADVAAFRLVSRARFSRQGRGGLFVHLRGKRACVFQHPIRPLYLNERFRHDSRIMFRDEEIDRCLFFLVVSHCSAP